jgi:PPK2 family polyphosphate:nucleotide phosphotransferase
MNIALENWDKYRVRPQSKVHLASMAADSTDFCGDKENARKELKSCRKEIDELLAALAAEEERSLLIVLQGVDASGKDGATRKVFTGVNPQHCKVVSFKEPDREERLHDYLWRIYRALPAKGELGIFNRSHYEDVIVWQARGKLARKDALIRLRQIADIERTWTENAIVIRKCFLHISRKEQTARFKVRLENREKHWKVKASDFEDRKRWSKFISAYDEVLSRTSADHAPWYIVPADHKWYRDLVIASIVLGALRSMRPRIPRVNLDPRRFKL